MPFSGVRLSQRLSGSDWEAGYATPLEQAVAYALED